MTSSTSIAPISTTPLNKEYSAIEQVTDAMNAYTGMCWYCSGVCDTSLGQPCPLLQPGPSGKFKLKCVTCSFPCMVSFITGQYKHNKAK